MKEFDHIKKTSQSAQTPPPSRIWDNVTTRLDNDNNEHLISKRQQYRWFSMTAACIAFIAVGSMIYLESNTLSEPPKGHIAGWEELQSTNSAFYDSKKLHGLYQAYNSRQGTNNPI